MLWLAEVLSLLGDQLARVALSVLVFDRTGSALLTGLVYGLSFLPALVAGPLLGGWRIGGRAGGCWSVATWPGRCWWA